jgi:2-haloacid dehalogenase
MSRWATFDCYGTLIDWNAGIGAVLEQLYGAERAPTLLRRYHELEPEVQADGYRSYSEILALTQSLPDWPPYPEVPAALAELRSRGWNLAILSNIDHALMVESEKRLGVPFDVIVTAEDVQSYKPAPGHWERFFEKTTADRDRHVHVGASLFHDVAPAKELGLKTVWISRGGADSFAHTSDATPDRELVDLSGLPDALDELVPA